MQVANSFSFKMNIVILAFQDLIDISADAAIETDGF